MFGSLGVGWMWGINGVVLAVVDMMIGLVVSCTVFGYGVVVRCCEFVCLMV